MIDFLMFSAISVLVVARLLLGVEYRATVHKLHKVKK